MRALLSNIVEDRTKVLGGTGSGRDGRCIDGIIDCMLGEVFEVKLLGFCRLSLSLIRAVNFEVGLAIYMGEVVACSLDSSDTFGLAFFPVCICMNRSRELLAENVFPNRGCGFAGLL